MKYGNMPFYSVDTNNQIIVAGTNEDIIFWDIRKLKAPLEVLDESHNEDVTSVNFHPSDYHKVITCSTDCLINLFNFEGKKSMKEEDEVLEATYCCEQPLLAVGYMPGRGKFWALTSVNTIEIINEETADLFTKVTKVSAIFVITFL